MAHRSFRMGDNLVVCQRSGRTCYASETRREWNGLIVHRDHWEPRHPLDQIRAPAPEMPPRITTGQPADRFLSDNEVTVDDL
jgi:hypothetical protein